MFAHTTPNPTTIKTRLGNQLSDLHMLFQYVLACVNELVIAEVTSGSFFLYMDVYGYYYYN